MKYTSFRSNIGNEVRKLDVHEDSILIICQVKGEWQTRDEKLRPYQKYLSKLPENFKEIKFIHLERDKNQFIDTITVLTSMAQIDCGTQVQPMCIEIINSFAYYCSIEKELDGKPWYYDIKKFIPCREYPRGSIQVGPKDIAKIVHGLLPKRGGLV